MIVDSRWNRRLGWIVIATCGYTVVAVALLHLLQPDFNPFSQAISEYVHGRYGFLMTVTFFSQSLGSLALAAISFRIGQGRRRSQLGGALFIVAALGAAVAGIFPADLVSPIPQTTAGTIHAAAGLVRFLALMFALPLLSPVLAVNSGSGPAAIVLKVLGFLFAAVFVVSILVLANIDLFGSGQRVFILILLVWMSVAVYPLLRRAGHETESSP